jgi:dihydroorotase
VQVPHSIQVNSIGVFTGSYTAEYLVHVLDSFGAVDKIGGFASEFGRQFYGLRKGFNESVVSLMPQPFEIPPKINYFDELGKEKHLVPFMAGEKLRYTIMSSGV